MPIVGFVEGRSAEATVRQAAAFRKALSETGYVESQNGELANIARVDGLQLHLEQRRCGLQRGELADVGCSPISQVRRTVV
jgi:hypothetical protein